MEKYQELENRIADAEAKQKEYEAEREKLLSQIGRQQVMGSSTGSAEQKCLSMFGVTNVKDLINVNTGLPRFKHVPLEYKGMVRQLKEDVDTTRMIQQVINGEKLDGADRPAALKGMLDGNYFAKNVLAPKLKAFGTGNVGAGAEWVPTLVSSQYIEEFELERKVAAKFRGINMPSSPFDVPVQTDVTIARRQPESCDPADNIASTNFGTDKITLDAEKLVEHMCLPEEMNEDSAPQILALARSEVVMAQERAFETAILNGDADGSHQDSDSTSATLAVSAWDGLRKLALANSANGSVVDFLGAATDLPKLRAMRTAMGKFGVNVMDLCWVVGPTVYNQMLALDEVTTVDNFGPGATILQGALAALDGIPIIISEYQREDLNATGVHDGVTTNLKTLSLVNHRRFMWGTRRPIRVRAVQDPTPPGDRWILASWWRGDFQGHAQGANEVSVVQGINVL